MKKTANPSLGELKFKLWTAKGRPTKSFAKARSFRFQGASGKYLKDRIEIPGSLRGRELREFFALSVVSEYFLKLQSKREARAISKPKGKGLRHHFRVTKSYSKSSGTAFFNFFKFERSFEPDGIEVDPESFLRVITEIIEPAFKHYHAKYRSRFNWPDLESNILAYYPILTFKIVPYDDKIKPYYADLTSYASGWSIMRRKLVMEFAKWWTGENRDPNKKSGEDANLYLVHARCLIQTMTKTPMFKYTGERARKKARSRS